MNYAVPVPSLMVRNIMYNIVVDISYVIKKHKFTILKYKTTKETYWMENLVRNLKVEIWSQNNNKIVTGVIAHIEKSLFYVEIDVPEVSEEKLSVGTHILLKVLGDSQGLKIYDATIKYRLHGLLHLGDLEINANIQRRNDVKVNIDHEAIITCTSKQPEEMISAHFYDLSAGGTCFKVNTAHRSYTEGDEFEMIFDMGDTPFFLKMRVLRAIEDDQGNVKYGCQFYDLGPEEEKYIREQVYKVQLASRKSIKYQI